jgi:hypothetical protein
VNLAFVGFAEGNDAGIEPMNQGSEGEKVQFSVFPNLQSVAHRRRSELFC